MKRRVGSGIGVFIAIAASLMVVLRPSVPKGPLPAQLDWLINRAEHKNHFSGTVLVARGGSVVYAKNIGPANAASRALIDSATPFPLASVSKPITALLILQLIDSGRLSTTDSLTKFFPALSGTAAGSITIHQLLTHTSGIEEVISRNPQQRITAEDLRTAVVKPGGYEYSNTGYVCLGLVIESVSGMSYAGSVAQRVFAVASMEHSGVLRANALPPNIAYGDSGTRAPADVGATFEALNGAGTLYATAADLVRFDRSVVNGKLVSTSQQLRMLTPQYDDHAYGWNVAEQDGKAYAWHSGNLPGYSTYFARLPARDEVLIILANQSGFDARKFARSVLRVLKQHP